MTSSLPQVRSVPEPVSEKDFSPLEILGIGGGALVILVLIYLCRRQKEVHHQGHRQVPKRMMEGTAEGASQILLTGGFQRKSPEERERLSPNCYTADPEGHFSYNYKGRGESYKSTSPLIQPTYYSTVISIEPYSRNGESKSSTSLQLEGYNQNPSEPPSPRVLKNRHNSAGSKSSFRDKRGSMKTTKASAASIRRSSGSFKEPRRLRPHDLDRPRHLSERAQSPRRACSLRAPQNPFPSPRPGISRREGLTRSGLCLGSESSVNTVKDHRDLQFPKFGESPSSHSVFSDECSNVGLWKRDIKRNGNRLQIRYNDAGSMEDLSYSRVEDDEMSLPVGAEAHSYPTSDYLTRTMGREDYNTRTGPGGEGEPQQIKYRALWELRATLEEQDWSSGANSDIRPIDSPNSRPPKLMQKEEKQRNIIPARGFPELSPDGEPLSSHTTSFESNTEAILADESKPPPKDATHLSSTSAKRQSFKNLLQQRLRREQARNRLEEPETGTSFDSVETLESTSTDTSRLDAITTSLESTDSTNDSQHVLFQKTKALSREKALRESDTVGLGGPRPFSRFFHRPGPSRDLEFGRREDPGPRRIPIPRLYNREEPFSTSSQLRKTFGRYERQSGSLESVKEPTEEEAIKPRNVFTRYFRSPRTSSAYYTRDYSIDERSDQLFREFTRFDPNLELPFNVKVHRRANSQKAPKSQECSSSGHQRYVSSSENIRHDLDRPRAFAPQLSPHSSSLLMADC